MKKAYRHFCKYVNGTRGVISILLCLVLCPFLSLSFLLVESSRYQQAAETLGEVNNNAAMSTLADKDSYLFDRFGLFAASQEGSIDAKYQGYLQKNWGVMGAGATLNGASVNLDYSLSLLDPDVLQQEIMEFSELNVSTQIASDGLDLDKLIDTLESIGDLDKIKKSLQAISATADVASATVDLIENVDKLLTALTAYNTKYSTYVSAHDAFVTAAMDLQATIKTEMDADSNLCYPKDMTPTPSPQAGGSTPSATKTSVYDNANVAAKITVLNEKISAYKSACDALSSNIEEIKGAVEGIIENLKTLKEKIEKVEELGEEDKSSETDKISESATASSKIYKDILDNFTSSLSEFEANDGVDKLEKNIESIKTTSLNLQNFNVESITGETTKAEIEAVYAVISITVPDAESLKDAEDNANSSLGADDNGDSIVKVIKDMITCAQGLLKLNGVCDGTLNAYINSEYMAKLNNATDSKPSSAQQVLDSITAMLKASDDFTAAISSWNLIGVLKAIKSALDAVVAFFNAIFSYFETVCDRIYELVTGGADGFYESLLVCGYCAYDFPNRTNKNDTMNTLDGDALTGYSYGDIATADPASSGPAGSLMGMVDFLKNLKNNTSNDITFCGAELEYILIGSQSEIVNQSTTFVYLYLLRMILNIIPICTNGEVAEMAGSANVGAPVVYVLEFILEPLCDTFILVNGGSSYLIKRNVYMTPTGLESLLKDVLGTTSLADTFKIGKSEDPPADKTKKTGGSLADFVKDGIFEVDYKDHLMFMLMFSCPQKTVILPRIQHLIQMESESYYKQQVADYTFELDKTYAYLNFNLDATLDPLFSIGSLSKTGYSYQKSVYRGY